MCWIQEQNEKGSLDYSKVAGANNPGDLMTKHLAEAATSKHMSRLGQRFIEGRAQSALKV